LRSRYIGEMVIWSASRAFWGTSLPSSTILHRELELLVRCGISPAQALAAATAEPARVFGIADQGRVAAGQRADLVLVSGDP
jgi:imidazolonepropionase-like amidohydrolase